MRTVQVNIIAEVTTTIKVEDGENVQDRLVDIYVHGSGKDGHINKKDHGADSIRITEV